MKNSVVIKGNNYGIVVVLDASISYEQLKISLANKFEEAAKFLGNKPIAISFEGRVLTTEEEREILDIITTHSQLKIMCVMDNDKKRELDFKNAISNKPIEVREQIKEQINQDSQNQFYKGTLRSGQVLECDGSIVVLGDANPGSKIVATGSVVVLGSLKGTAYAGINGETAFVIALEMEPMQIKIGDVIARSSKRSILKNKETEPKIAFLENENIYIEKLTKELLNEI